VQSITLLCYESPTSDQPQYLVNGSSMNFYGCFKKEFLASLWNDQNLIYLKFSITYLMNQGVGPSNSLLVPMMKYLFKLTPFSMVSCIKEHILILNYGWVSHSCNIQSNCMIQLHSEF
jgi:hypothetical protein